MNNYNMASNSAASPPGREEAGEPAKIGAPLSNAHIGRKVIYIAGASILKTTKGEKMEQKGGGIRGSVSGFSRQSRYRLMQTIGRVQRQAELPNFVTLTYPKNFPTVEQAKYDLKKFLERLKYNFPGAGYIWKLEPQERGAPHYHMLVWGCETKVLFDWVCENWFDIAGQGDINALLFLKGLLKDSKPCVSKVRSWRGVWRYASKYLGKTFEVAQWGSKWTGRFWGVGKRENIPFGPEMIIDCDLREVVQIMRFQRRYAHIKGRSQNSLTIFCDADQWIKKLFNNHVQPNSFHVK
jgi:hypothetical protein